MAAHLLITSVPPGQAPLWVREHWVGLILPLAQRQEAPVSLLTSGVVSGPKGLLSCLTAFVTGKLERQSGFVVETGAAVAVLELKHPEAAAWWRTNATHLFRGKRYFVFQEGTGRIVET
jgi:hypothetical protein